MVDNTRRLKYLNLLYVEGPKHVREVHEAHGGNTDRTNTVHILQNLADDGRVEKTDAEWSGDVEVYITRKGEEYLKHMRGKGEI